MKLFQFIGSIVVCIIVSVPATANIIRVNNNPGVNANFTTLQAAHDAAAPGDTIHVEGSLTQYLQATISKKLFIVGTGYFLDQVSETQANVFPATLNNLTFNAGAEGSVVTGVEFFNSLINIYCDNITITRNRLTHDGSNNNLESYNSAVKLFTRNDGLPVNDITISQNYGGYVVIERASTRVLIVNNYLLRTANEGDASNGELIRADASAVVLIKNNVFKRGMITVNNSTLTNNIMINGSMATTSVNNVFLNNIGSGTQFGTANGNQSNVSMDNVFVGVQTGVSKDGQLKLRPGSPAIGAGEGSTAQNPVDCGMYGGVTRYIVAGQAVMPAIYYMEVQAAGTTTDPIDVKLKVKSAGK